MTAVMDGLNSVFKELEQVCEEISSISDDIDELNSLEDIRMNIEICVAVVTDHLDGRRDEPPSTETSSWVAKHAHLSCTESQNSLEIENNALPPSVGGGGARPRNSDHFPNVSSRDVFGDHRLDYSISVKCSPG